MTLELSSTDEVANYLGIVATTEDLPRLTRSLAVGREQITRMVLPEADLPTPIPQSLHEAVTVRAAQHFALKTKRYGYNDELADTGDGTPPFFTIQDLVMPWMRSPITGASTTESRAADA